MISPDKDINIASLGKLEKYAFCGTSIRGISEGEIDLIANLANATAILHNTFGWWWVGFYLVRDGELVLGPFQGQPACVRINIGQGVCGAGAAKRETVIVPNVHEFPGHIACDSASNSEIVVPLVKEDRLIAVLDLDSPVVSRFDQEDAAGLAQLVRILLSSLSA